MLILKPPYFNIDGITLFPDHANDLQWYYAPADPSITTLHDPVLDQFIPQISLLKYRGEAGTGGFLDFDVNLGFPDEKLDEVRRKLKRMAGLRDDPMLAPVPVVDGSVRLLMLGKASDDEPPEDGDAAPQGPKFVEKIAHASKPSLYGKNQAVFSVSLDEDGVKIMEQSLQGETMAIGVVYSLEFFALRPAYNVSITADWDRMQHHFEESSSFDSIFYQSQVDEVLDELIENQVIQINVDTFVPEDEDDIGFAGRRDRAVNDFKDMVLQTFFQPSVDPIDPNADDGGTIDDIVDGHERLAGVAARAGGLIPSFSRREVDITRIDKKSVNLNMSERTAVRRSIYPQGHLAGMFRLLRDADGQLDLTRFVKEITLDDDWFKRRTLDARSLVDFEHDNIASINVTANYNGRPKSILLDKSAPKGIASWNSVLQNNRMKRDVEYQYRVNFSGVNSAERPAILNSPELVTPADIFEVNPRGEELFYLDDITIAARENFPWSDYPEIEVHLKYEDQSSAIDIKDSFVLRSGSEDQVWKRFRMDKEKSAYQMKVIFRGADNDDREIDWQDYDQELFTIGNPRPKSRTVQVVPALDWTQVTTLLVELSYTDTDNDIFEEQTMTFLSTQAAPQTFAIGLLNPDVRVVEYSISIIWANGAVTRVPRSKTVENTILITPFMKGHRLIEVSADTSNFDSKGVTKVEVELSYEDSEAGLQFAEKLRLTKTQASGIFEFDYASKQRNKYRAIQKTFFNNGMVQTKDHGEIGEDVLLITVS